MPPDQAFLAGLIMFAFGLLFAKAKRTARENEGEAAVRRALTRQFTGSSYHLMNNLTLPCDDGTTTQIDHVLVSRSGIFVIEAKHYSGRIHVSHDRAPQWKRIYGQYGYSFQNPLRQNYKHLKVIEQYLDFVSPEHIHPLVVFTGTATFTPEWPEGVFTVRGVVQYIRECTDTVLTENRLQWCVGRLECQRKHISRKTDVEHVAALNRKFGEVA